MLYIIKKFSLIVFCLIPLLLTGCWNNKEITDLGIVVGLGLEKDLNDQVEITIQLINTNILESRKQGSMKKATQTISAKGKTIFEANRNLLSKTNKKLFYSNMRLTVIGEKLARNGLEDTMDFFQRFHEIDKRGNVIISKGITPREVFEIEAEQAEIPAEEMIDTINNTTKLAAIRKMPLYQVIMNIVGEGNSVVGKVEVSERKETIKMTDLIFTGAAVLKKDKLIGWLNPIETYGLLIADNKFENSILNIENPINPEKNVSIEVISSVAKKNVYFENEEPVLSIEVHTVGKMVAQQGKGDLTSPEQIKALETEVSQKITNIICDVISNAQENYHTDIFGFGELVHKKNLTYWRKVKSNWDDIFSDLPVKIEVQHENRDAGFIKAHK